MMLRELVDFLEDEGLRLQVTVARGQAGVCGHPIAIDRLRNFLEPIGRERHEAFKPLVTAVVVAIDQLNNGQRANIRDIQSAIINLPLDAAKNVGLLK